MTKKNTNTAAASASAASSKKVSASKKKPAAVKKPAAPKAGEFGSKPVIGKTNTAGVAQLKPHGPVTISIPQGKGFRDVPLLFKAALILAILRASGSPMPKGGNEGVTGEPGTLLYELQKLGGSQGQVNTCCRVLESLGLATMRTVEGQGRTLFREATELGTKVQLMQGDKRVPLTVKALLG